VYREQECPGDGEVKPIVATPCAEEKAIRLEHSGEIELTDGELAAVRGAADSYSIAPVSLTCLQSILLGEGHCGTQSLGEDYFYATVSKDPGRSQ